MKNIDYLKFTLPIRAPCHSVFIVFLLAGLFALNGCALMPDGARWRETARRSATMPSVWGPVFGAAIVTGFDRRISSQAQDKTPIFDSRENAADSSNKLRDRLNDLVIVSVIATSLDNEQPTDAFTRQMLAALFEFNANGALTTELKAATNRQRPGTSGDDSFPSGHTARAFGAARFISDNLHRQQWFGEQNWLADTLLYGSASAVAWARVESGAHYPSDVLIGAAIGNFFSHWAQLLWLEEPTHFSWMVSPDSNGLTLHLAVQF